MLVQNYSFEDVCRHIRVLLYCRSCCLVRIVKVELFLLVRMVELWIVVIKGMRDEMDTGFELVPDTCHNDLYFILLISVSLDVVQDVNNSRFQSGSHGKHDLYMQVPIPTPDHTLHYSTRNARGSSCEMRLGQPSPQASQEAGQLQIPT